MVLRPALRPCGLPGLRLMMASVALLLGSTAFYPAHCIRLLFEDQAVEHGTGTGVEGPDRLGVARVQLYVKVPLVRDGVDQNTTITTVANLWLRRVGGEQAAPHALPHQRQDAIRGFMWLDDPSDLRLRGPCAHLRLPTDHKTWQPKLLLQHGAGGPPLEVVVNMEHMIDASMTDPIRPYSFHVDLPPKAGSCFKLLEASFPEHRVGFCLHHHTKLCRDLAPSDRHTPDQPALWSVIGPLRDYHVEPGPGWAEQARRTAVWVHHYLSYHLAMGVSGLLLYADHWGRGLMHRDPLLEPYLRDGTLRLITWNLMEREDIGGNYAYNGYNYDQALFTSHALLGLSACGTNLRLLLTDVDEFLHTPTGQPWPAPMACMTAPQPGDVTAMTVVMRHNMASSTVAPREEPALWSAAPPAGAAAAAPPAAHPLARYDLMAKEPLPWMHGKRVVLPAAEIIAYFVHEGFALHGRLHTAELSCVGILHVSNLVQARIAELDPAQYGNFSNWVLEGQPDVRTRR